MMKIILASLFFCVAAYAEEFNLYIEYCPTNKVAECSEIKIQKAVDLLEAKGFKITEEAVTEKRIVIQLHDGCSFFEICPPHDYAEQAIIRLQDPQTFQTFYEQVVRRNVYPRTSKALLKGAIEGFSQIVPNQ